ncbi:MAG: ribulose-phosphate 3-epimerase [bacterium]|nr:ribulose-phosphate 3-epimerase [bacterium]
MSDIIPSILVKTRQEFEEKIRVVEGLVTQVHLDISDGLFVPNTTIDGVTEVNSLDTELNIGVHLMVQKPENHIGRWLETPVNKIVVHAEATNKLEQIINMVKEADAQIAVALNPSTPHDKIKHYINELDYVHFMTVEPGFYGGKFVPEVIDKIKDFHFLYPDVPIEVDGSVNPDTISELAEAGASIFVVGSYFWHSDDKQKALDKLNELVSNK